MDCNKDKKITVTNLRDYPIDNLASIPDYILAERDVTSETDGATRNQIVRVPGRKLFPNGNMDNITTIGANNTELVVPENQVRACRIVNDGSQNSVQYADTTHEAQFLAVGTLGTDLLIQNSGFVIIPEGHEYIIGIPYYTGANGVPTADNSSGQYLFTPISNTKLALNIGA